MSRRPRLVASLAVLVVLALAGGWFAARNFESPAQRAADARPPAAQPVLVPIERRALVKTVTAQARISREHVFQVNPSSMPSPAIVTSRIARVGQRFSPGQPLATVDGRPLFAFPGRFPFYRDLYEGDSGIDVTQLQRGLRAAGYVIPAEEHGVIGAVTTAAMASIYNSAGFRPPGATSTNGSPGKRSSRQLVLLPQEIAVVATTAGVVTRLPRIGATLSTGHLPLEIASGPVVAEAEVSSATAGQLRAGLTASVVRGRITRHGAVLGHGAKVAIADPQPVNRQGATPNTTIVAIATHPPLLDAWLGQRAVATITLRTVHGSAMVVPTRALVSGPGGQLYVLADRAGTLRRIAVRRLGSLAGQTAIASISKGGLAVGESVEVSD